MLKAILISSLLASAAMVSARPETAGRPYMLMPRFNTTSPTGSNGTQGVPMNGTVPINGTSPDAGTGDRKGKGKGKGKDKDQSQDGADNKKFKRDEVTSIADELLPPVNSTLPTNGTFPINGTLPTNGTAPGNSTILPIVRRRGRGRR